jgi:16S rRNA (adenine1518-N6/adenine1519-N6)-dimethyltransferase
MMFPSISIIKSLDIRPSKALGQNFLIDQHIAAKITSVCEVTDADTVIEIGAGLGALSGFLAENAHHVFAIEIDHRLAAFLQRFNDTSSRLTVVNDNILTIPLSDLIFSSGRAVFAGNIPYAITTSVFTRLAECSHLIKHGVFMVQKEAAERITAQSGNKNYGVLSINTQRYFTISLLFNVPASCFFPQPKIDSTVLRLDPIPNRNWNSLGEDRFREIVVASLSHRRKTLANCLKAYASGKGIDEEVLKSRLFEAGIDCTRRGETLSLLEFETLATVITDLMSVDSTL